METMEKEEDWEVGSYLAEGDLEIPRNHGANLFKTENIIVKDFDSHISRPPS
jgi:hypothetical protein